MRQGAVVLLCLASAWLACAIQPLPGFIGDPTDPLPETELVYSSVDTDPSARLGETFAPTRPFATRVWTNTSSPSFRYPELAFPGPFWIPSLTQAPDVGVALGGGGLRAAALADGWLRGLHQVGAARAATAQRDRPCTADFLGMAPSRRAAMRPRSLQ